MATRAAFVVSVRSITEGWEYTSTQGDAAVDFDTEPVQLVDDLKLSWSVSDYPLTWDAETAQVALRCRSAADVPALAPGDVLLVKVSREYTIAHPPPAIWWQVAGVAGEPVLERVKSKRAPLRLTFPVTGLVAWLSELMVSASVDSAGTPIPWPEEPVPDRLARIAQSAKINLYWEPFFGGGTLLNRCGPVTPNNKSALALIDEVLAGNPQATSFPTPLGGVETVQPVIRAALQGRTFDSGVPYTVAEGSPNGPADPLAFWVGYLSNAHYISANAYVATAAACVLPGQAAGPTVAQRTLESDVSGAAYGLVLEAGDVLADGVKWTKARDDATNQVKLVGLDATGAEASVLATLPGLVQRYGPTTREVQSVRLLLDGVFDRTKAASLLDPDSAVPDWSVDTFTFTTRDLSDADLDDYCTRFNPDGGSSLAGPDGEPMQIPVAVVGVSEPLAVNGRDLQGVLTGAQFVVSKGELTVTGTIKRAHLWGVGALTYTQMRSLTVSGSGGALAWSAFTYHAASAAPASYTAAATTFDAAAADPSFDCEQLTYRDLRLTGAT